MYTVPNSTVSKEKTQIQNIIIAETQSIELDGTVTKATTIAAVEELKSYNRMSQQEIERLQIGDPIACDWCDMMGVWDPEDNLAGGIVQSKYHLSEEYLSPYVCNDCEERRQDIFMDQMDS